MTETLIGYESLQRRLAAIKGPILGPSIMRSLGTAAVGEAKLLVPRRTSNLGRTIHLADVTPTSAEIVASAAYAAYVEEGTRPHEITPRARKALAWAAGPAGGKFRRLSGSTRTGTPQGAMTFAKRVHHPGTKPHPYLRPGAQKAIEKSHLTDTIVAAWNEAA